MSGPKSYKWLSLELNWTMSFFDQKFCHIAASRCAAFRSDSEKIVTVDIGLPKKRRNNGPNPSRAYVTIFNDFQRWACFKPLLKLNNLNNLFNPCTQNSWASFLKTNIVFHLEHRKPWQTETWKPMFFSPRFFVWKLFAPQCAGAMSDPNGSPDGSPIGSPGDASPETSPVPPGGKLFDSWRMQNFFLLGL